MVEGFRFSHKLKVRYSEIDGQRIVFNAHYLTYLDIAIAEYFVEGLQLDLLALADDGTFDFVVAKSTLEYKNSALLNDWLTIWCRTKKIGNTSMTMEFVITRERETDPLILAEIVYVSIDPKNYEKRPVPAFIRECIENYEYRCKLP